MQPTPALNGRSCPIVTTYTRRASPALICSGIIRGFTIPVTVVSRREKRKLTGTVGQGHGKLYLRTHNGSIKIR
jgi:hypothetical protein